MPQHHQFLIRLASVIFWWIVGCGFSYASVGSTTTLLTADTEGHVTACATCPNHAGLGGLVRRATLLKSLRAEHPGALVIDAGNALFGEESISSGGAIIASAYSAMGYDLLNLSDRDFAQGKAHTLDLLKQARLRAISANLVDESTGQPIVEPFAVLTSGGRKIAFLGLAKAPPALAALPDLQRQLAGIRFRPETEALAEWLPKARAQADAVVIVYSGSASGRRAVQRAAGDAVAAILATGENAETTGEATAPIVATAQKHGVSIAVVTLAGKDVKVEQAVVQPTLAVDPAMAALVDRFAMAVPSSPAEAATSQPSVPPPAAPVAAAPPHDAPPPAANPPANSPSPAMAPAAPSAVASNTPPPQPAASPAPQPRVATNQPLTPKGLAGVNLTAEQVNAAIDRGRDFLWGYLRDQQQKHPDNPLLIQSREDLLAALALVSAGAPDRIPAFNAELRKYLDQSDPRRMQLGTYESGIYGMLIEAFADPTYLPKLRETARSLVELEGRGGSWNYGTGQRDASFYGPPASSSDRALRVFGGTPIGEKPAVEVLDRNTPYLKDADGDNSTSQFALLGLRSASRWYMNAAPDIWQRNLAITRVRQRRDGSWDYNDTEPTGYGSMTCAGVCALAIDRYQLGEKEPAADEQIERGLAWLDQHFSVTANPQKADYLYYYLYSLERVGQILGTEFIGSHEWYPLGARYLVDAQKPSGKWVELNEQEDPRLATSFALLFLTRATSTLNNVMARNGSGELRTAVTMAPPSRLYLILDASGSMLDEMDGRLKFDLAREAASAMLQLLPAGAEAALRVYGHRLRSLDPKSDEDTELKLPMQKYDPQKFMPVLQSVRPRGKTPLALSLTLAMQDLGDARDPTTLVLLTDGGEDTMPRRDPVKVAAELTKRPNITFDIIGYDINEQDWNIQLRAMAQASGGKYWPAPRGGDLARAVRAALLGEPEYYRVLDSTGKEAFRGQFGQGTRLLEGKYDLVTPYAGREFHQTFWINTKATTVVTFDATAATHDPTAREITPESAPPPTPAPVAVRYCTHCGNPLPPGAKFCPHCGAKVPVDQR